MLSKHEALGGNLDIMTLASTNVGTRYGNNCKTHGSRGLLDMKHPLCVGSAIVRGKTR